VWELELGARTTKRGAMTSTRSLPCKPAILECQSLGGKGEREKRENRWLEGEEMVRVMEEKLVGSRRVIFIFIFPFFLPFFFSFIFTAFFWPPSISFNALPCLFTLITRFTDY
jgi:hypothetical protein